MITIKMSIEKEIKQEIEEKIKTNTENQLSESNSSSADTNPQQSLVYNTLNPISEVISAQSSSDVSTDTNPTNPRRSLVYNTLNRISEVISAQSSSDGVEFEKWKKKLYYMLRTDLCLAVLHYHA